MVLLLVLATLPCHIFPQAFNMREPYPRGFTLILSAD